MYSRVQLHMWRLIHRNKVTFKRLTYLNIYFSIHTRYGSNLKPNSLGYKHLTSYYLINIWYLLFIFVTLSSMHYYLVKKQIVRCHLFGNCYMFSLKYTNQGYWNDRTSIFFIVVIKYLSHNVTFDFFIKLIY